MWPKSHLATEHLPDNCVITPIFSLSNTLTSQQVFHTQIGNHHIAAFLITYVQYFSYFHLPTSVSALQCFHFSHYKNGTNNSCYICVHTVIGLSLMKLLLLNMLHRVMQKNWELIKEDSSQSKTRSVCILILNYSLTFGVGMNLSLREWHVLYVSNTQTSKDSLCTCCMLNKNQNLPL